MHFTVLTGYEYMYMHMRETTQEYRASLVSRIETNYSADDSRGVTGNCGKAPVDPIFATHHSYATS